ncbi:MAG: haloacid dehalogenase [Desulfurococcales archaeon]|nr:haloacid dehalogenase [Desulfurococcales archaeon]
MNTSLPEMISSIKEKLDTLDSIRNEALKISRDVIRLSGWSITKLHEGDIDDASKHLEECGNTSRKLLDMTKPYPVLYYSGFVNNAISEYVEAEVFYNIITVNYIPTPSELSVPIVPYLQGLADTVGELKRMVLDYLGKNKLDDAEKLFGWMYTIYSELRGLDYPDSLVPGLKRKVDVARRLVDDTKAFLVDLRSRYELINLMDRIEGLSDARRHQG